MPAEDKITKLREKRDAAIEAVNSTVFKDDKGNPLPEMAQYLGRKGIIAKFVTDAQLEAIDNVDFIEKQLHEIDNWESTTTLRGLVLQAIPVGTDYKGQLQSCLTVLGHGIKTTTSVDPEKIAGLGLLSTEIETSAEAVRSEKLLIVIQKHPDKINNKITTNQPITLHPMYGTLWETELGSSLFTGVTTETPLQPRVYFNEELAGDSAVDSPTIPMETLSLKAEAKAGFEADATYKYENIYLFNDTPIYHRDKATFIDSLTSFFQLGEREADIKANAIGFQNEHKLYFTKQKKYQRILGIQRRASTVAKWLEKGLLDKNLPAEIERRAKQYAVQLKPFYKSLSHNGYSFLALSSHKATGSAGLIAEAGVSGNLLGDIASAEVTAKVDSLNIEGAYKRAHFRYQSKTPLGTYSRPVIYHCCPVKH